MDVVRIYRTYDYGYMNRDIYPYFPMHSPSEMNSLSEEQKASPKRITNSDKNIKPMQEEKYSLLKQRILKMSLERKKRELETKKCTQIAKSPKSNQSETESDSHTVEEFSTQSNSNKLPKPVPEGK